MNFLQKNSRLNVHICVFTAYVVFENTFDRFSDFLDTIHLWTFCVVTIIDVKRGCVTPAFNNLLTHIWDKILVNPPLYFEKTSTDWIVQTFPVKLIY